MTAVTIKKSIEDIGRGRINDGKREQSNDKGFFFQPHLSGTYQHLQEASQASPATPGGRHQSKQKLDISRINDPRAWGEAQRQCYFVQALVCQMLCGGFAISNQKLETRERAPRGRKTYQLTKMDQDNAGIRSGQTAQETLYIYVYMYICIYVYMYIYTHMYIYICTTKVVWFPDQIGLIL